MRSRPLAAIIGTLLLLALLDPAACVFAQAAAPFPEVRQELEPRHSHWIANLTIAAGAGLIGASFAWRDRANRNYSDYLSATDPGEIQNLYDRTVHEDRLSSASLISGEVLIAAGLYLRFIHRPAAARLDLALGTQRCAVCWRF